VIKTFKDKEADKLFHLQRSTKLPDEIQRVAIRKLWMIDAAHNINDLRVPPANHLEKLEGKRKGQYSIRINDRYRVCFEWIDGDAFNVEIVDYH
jgi:proteic killer suppression protein